MSGELVVTIDSPQMGVLLRALKKKTTVLAPLKRLLKYEAVLAQQTSRKNAPKDTASLQRSILINVQPLFATVYTPLAYAPVMEYGRRPGSRMPPPMALAGWAARHGIPQTSLFVLARAIAGRGLSGRFFMKKAATAVEADLPKRLDVMREEINQFWLREQEDTRQ